VGLAAGLALAYLVRQRALPGQRKTIGGERRQKAAQVVED
jgi:hypothetical protein